MGSRAAGGFSGVKMLICISGPPFSQHGRGFSAAVRSRCFLLLLLLRVRCEIERTIAVTHARRSFGRSCVM